MGFTLQAQTVTFLISVSVGFLLCLCYDMFKILRMSVKHSTLAFFIEDIIYSVLAAFVTFIFLLSQTGGRVRSYVLLGELLGFFLFRLTLSRAIIAVADVIIKAVKAILRFIDRIFVKPLIKLLKMFYGVFKKLAVFIHSIACKILISIKNLFKKWYSILQKKKNHLEKSQRMVENGRAKKKSRTKNTSGKKVGKRAKLRKEKTVV